MVTKQQVIEWAKRHGWETDKYGHLTKTVGPQESPVTYRLKLSNIAARKEHHIVHERDDFSGYKPPNTWMRVASGYYKDITIDDKDILHWPSR